MVGPGTLVHSRPSMEVAKSLLGWPFSVLLTALPGPGKWDRTGLSWASSIQVLEPEESAPSCYPREVPLGKETWRIHKSSVFVLSGARR